MKRLAISSVLLLLSALFALGLCSCGGIAAAGGAILGSMAADLRPFGGDKSHTHEYESLWSSDATHHFRACRVAGCQKTVDKKEHNFGEWRLVEYATCSAEGLRVRDCEDCLYQEQEHLPIREGAHDFGEWVTDVPATCQTEGSRYHTCTLCFAEERESIAVKPTAHSFGGEWVKDATHHWHECQNKGCAATDTKVAHRVTEWTVDEAATCVSTGARHGDCAACGQPISESIPVDDTAHSYSPVWSADELYRYSTCTAEGCQKRAMVWHWLTFSLQNGTYTVTGYEGDGGEVIIPATCNGRPVTAIANSAFEKAKSITSVIIPDSVTEIGDRAFYSCTTLEEVSLGASVKRIGEEAFMSCWLLSEIVIPDSVESLGSYVFGICSGLTQAVIGNSVKSIPASAFWHCRSLTTVTVGNAVTSIGDSAFSQCESLKRLTLPATVTSIGWCAFDDCVELTMLTLQGKALESIGMSAFRGCRSLSYIYYGGTVAEWKAIEKDLFWSEGAPITVYCVGGTFKE